MGSLNRRYVPPPPTTGEKAPEGPRVYLASDVVAELMRVLKDRVIRGSVDHQSEERECYEVARDLRDQKANFERAIKDTLPGGQLKTGSRMSLIEKIVMVFLDAVSLVLIRPGPTPEDRQASDLVTEADDMIPGLVRLVGDVIQVDDDAQGLRADEDLPGYGEFA